MAVQESLGAKPEEYYDVIIAGHTGQGKSTLTDKLLIANPDHKNYQVGDPVFGSDTKKLQYDDLSMWLCNSRELAKIETRFKSLVDARTKPEPHKRVNKIREDLGSERTTHCEVFSNDTTKIRILDVQGFFDQDSLVMRGQLSPGGAQVHSSNIGIMRKILRVQTTLNMKFKRILFFLPQRGVLERADAVLQLELKALTHFFGLRVLEKVVLVVTNPPDVSALGLPDDQIFPEKARAKTKENFKECLKIIFGKEQQFPDFPLIYISMSESCESILKKVKPDGEDEEGIELQLDPNTCELCGKQVGVVKGERIACYIHQDDKVPYDESLCHPKLIPDYKLRHRVAEYLVYLVTFGKVTSLAKFFSLDEICVGCGEAPNANGCEKVGNEFKYKGETIIVDHKCNKWAESEREFQQILETDDPQGQ